MLIDLIPYEEMPLQSSKIRAVRALINLLSRKLGLSIGYDARRLPQGNLRLLEPYRLAEQLKASGVIKSFSKNETYPDEPPFYLWSAVCNVPNEHVVAGASFETDDAALMAALAEGLERYIWLTQDDYFTRRCVATEREIVKKGPAILPHEWVGFSAEQRALTPERALSPDAHYLWIHAESLTSRTAVSIPAQIISGRSDVRARSGGIEPIIRYVNTNGLATWPTQRGARLAGMLELVEREAYMIMWYNQLSLPRIELTSLAERDQKIAQLLRRCERYRLKLHAIRLITDAPAFAICVVLEDLTDTAPRFTVGLKAHRSLSIAIQKACHEALRARRGYRAYRAQGNTWNRETPVLRVGHRERLYYWSEPAHADGLAFMIAGAYASSQAEPWESDTEDAHYARMINWCKTEQLACVAVSLGRSKKNPTALHIEMVAMPQLQPTYLRETDRAFGGDRWRTIPEKYGYTPLAEPFAAHPHPFS